MSSPRTVLGLDLSLTATGVALIRDGHSMLSTVRSRPTGPSCADRLARLQDMADAVLRAVVHTPHLVVVEGPSLGSKGGMSWDRAGLWWLVVSAFPVVCEVPPTVLKKFAVGKGNADKTAVAAGMTRLWPDLTPANDNEFDALALATMGAQRLGMDVPTRAHHAEAVAKVLWPAGLPEPIHDEGVAP